MESNINYDAYDLCIEAGFCPVCGADIEATDDDDEHHQEVVCGACGFHYCITCQHMYG